MSLDELPGSGGFSGKMKRNKSYSQHVSKRQDEDEEIMVCNQILITTITTASFTNVMGQISTNNNLFLFINCAL